VSCGWKQAAIRVRMYEIEVGVIIGKAAERCQTSNGGPKILVEKPQAHRTACLFQHEMPVMPDSRGGIDKD